MSFYLFIDGAYFQKAYSQEMLEFYNEIPTINYREFGSTFGNPRRIYYYDAVDRNQQGQETSQQRDARVDKLDSFHRYLNSIPLWHVREGFVSRGRRANRRSQKAVDVQLAVDALEHAVAGNIKQASFILGDLDFEPLMFSLSRCGVETTVHYEHLTASDELLEAVDIRRQMTLQTFHGLAIQEFKGPAPAIHIQENGARPRDFTLIRTGLWKGRTIELFHLVNVNGAHHHIWLSPGLDPIREPSIAVSYPPTELTRRPDHPCVHAGCERDTVKNPVA